MQTHLVTWMLVLSVVMVTECIAWRFPPKYEYEYAKKYSMDDLASSSAMRHKFMTEAFTAEGYFHQDGIGVDIATGLTFDGHAIGLPSTDGLHPFSAASKEALHLSLIAKALLGNEYARLFFNVSANGADINQHLIQLLTGKMKAYESFDKTYPGYGGYLPWFHVVKINGSLAPQPDWNYRVPSLDNGEWVWGLYAVSNALLDVGERGLAFRYSMKLKQLANNAKMMFYQPKSGKYAAEVKINDIYSQPSPAQYHDNIPGYALDDPYEGELFTVFCDLFCGWNSTAERDQIWVNKRAKLQPVTYHMVITTQKGWWFSAHEQWKILELPYMDTKYASKVLANAEAARTLASLKDPGLKASITGISGECGDRGYVSDCGIQELSFQQVTCNSIVTPYAATPVMMVSLPVGLMWYANMVNGSRGQGPCGSTEAVNLIGTNIAPVLTWDSKANGILGMIGGIADIVKNYLQRDHLYDRFVSVIDREYYQAFGDVDVAETVPPLVPLPNYGGFK